MMYELWTDGSCKANGTDKAVGAWGYILKEERGIIAKDVKAEKATTNNRMEMISIIEGIEALKKAVPNFGLCLVHSDSAYVMNCFVQKWYRNWKKNGWINSKKEPVKNKDLWEKIIPYFEDERFTWHKVKGHAGVDMNEMVDSMVQSAAEKLKGELDA